MDRLFCRSFGKIFFAVTVLCFLALPSIRAHADQAWESAFYNDVDGDGDTELLPYVYNGLTSIDSYTFYQKYNVVDSSLYDFPDAADDERYDELWNTIYFDYNETDPDDSYAVEVFRSTLVETYGEMSKETAAFDLLIQEYNEFVEYYWNKYDKANALYEAACNAFVAEHPEIRFGHSIDPQKTVNTTAENQLLYWIHIPFDYDPGKSYPLLVYAHGEDQSLRITRYINADGSYTMEKANMSTDINGFMNQWYGFVKEPGENRDKYDCFFIYICNTNEFFRGRNCYPGIVGQYNDYDADTVSLDGAYTGDTNYRGNYYHTYDASRLSPGLNEQLLVQLIDDLSLRYSIDLDRQYIMGFSLGGIFTMDIISQYPDRFAAAIPICTASADISEENCKELTNTNVWAISGNGDGNCNKYFSKYFVLSINAAREKFGTGSGHIAQFSLLPGGHSGSYAGPTLRTAASGVSITSATQIIDFLFDSVRDDAKHRAYCAGISSEIVPVATASAALSSDRTTIEVTFAAGDFPGGYGECGFVYSYRVGTTVFTRLVWSSGTLPARSFAASDHDAETVFFAGISGIPANADHLTVLPFISNGGGEFYGIPTDYEIVSSDEGIVLRNVSVCASHHSLMTASEEAVKTYTCLRCGTSVHVFEANAAHAHRLISKGDAYACLDCTYVCTPAVCPALNVNLTLRANFQYNIFIKASDAEKVSKAVYILDDIEYPLSFEPYDTGYAIASVTGIPPLRIGDPFAVELTYVGDTYVWDGLSVLSYISGLMKREEIDAKEKTALSTLVAYAKALAEFAGYVPEALSAFDTSDARTGAEIQCENDMRELNDVFSGIGFIAGEKAGFRFTANEGIGVVRFSVGGQSYTHDFAEDSVCVLSLRAGDYASAITVTVGEKNGKVSIGLLRPALASAIANYAAAYAAAYEE